MSAYAIQTINGKDYKPAYGFHFNAATPDEVISKLASLYSLDTRCRIFYGDTVTGRSWLDEYDVTGTIGRSTGSIKIPLIINNSRSMGGPAILDHCIIGIQVQDCQWLYRHPDFHTGEMLIVECDDNKYPFAVHVQGAVHARFSTREKAQRFVDFMQGKRMRAY